ncbi:MAG: hypothetical protein KJ941_11365 [Bacteroidetes bacterium]|nr:hypothetical protein [Bacteroidota bacterium]
MYSNASFIPKSTIFVKLIDWNQFSDSKVTTTGMIKCFSSFALFAILIVFTSCSTKETETEKDLDLAENYDNFQKFDLTKFNIAANIMLPGPTANIGASLNPEVMYSEGGFKWDVNVGPNFSLHIEDWGANTDLVTDRKKKLKDLEMYEINYIVDKPEMIIYKSTLKVSGDPKASANVGVLHEEYHVYGEKVINDITYEFRSPDAGYEDKRIIELMAKTIQSVEVKKKLKP